MDQRWDAAAQKKNRSCSIALVVLGVLGLAILVAMVIAIPKMAGAKNRSSKRDCTSNLSKIGEAIHSYRQRYGHYPPGTGSAFLENLRQGVPDLAPDDLFVCPAKGTTRPRLGVSDYLGPAQPLGDDVPADRPIVADISTNHGHNEDVVVLFMDGHCDLAPFGSVMWKDVETWVK